MHSQVATDDHTDQDQGISLDDIYDFETFARLYPGALPKGEATLKWIFRNRDRNGTKEAGVFVTTGRSPRVVEQRFCRWYLSRHA